MRKSTKNKLLKSITIIALVINTAFSMLTVWVENFKPGLWFIIWAIAQLWIILFILNNFERLLNSKKSRKVIDNNKFFENK